MEVCYVPWSRHFFQPCTISYAHQTFLCSDPRRRSFAPLMEQSPTNERTNLKVLVNPIFCQKCRGAAETSEPHRLHIATLETCVHATLWGVTYSPRTLNHSWILRGVLGCLNSPLWLEATGRWDRATVPVLFLNNF